jgi:hypothetical protein
MKSFLVGILALILAPIALVIFAPLVFFYLVRAAGDYFLGRPEAREFRHFE